MKHLKSIKSLRSCTLISMFKFLMTVIISSNGVVAKDTYIDIIRDLPAPKDFDDYLIALENTVDFCVRYKHFVDYNLKFGLFLIDVNLRLVMQQKRTGLPVKTRARLEKLFEQNDELTKYFVSMVTNKFKEQRNSEQNLKLALLFSNVTRWRNPIEFNTGLLNQTDILDTTELQKIYDTWEKYSNKVENYAENKPSPAEVDECISLLAQTQPLHIPGRSQRNCLTSSHCKAVMRGANKFGYGLTHRLLFMVVAHFPRRCSVFSEEEDRNKTDVYCMKCYNEATYIALNTFQLPDLMCEQIALCGLFGHAHFMRNYWMKTLLQFQTSQGCFSEKITTGDYDEHKILENEFNEWKLQRPYAIMNGQCNGHFTGLAAATFSNALRYIIETYY